MTVDLAKSNFDYALFLPSISNFYQKLLSDIINVAKDGNAPYRAPLGLEKGLQGCNFLSDSGYFYYPWGLFSAGHARLDLKKCDRAESVIHSRDKSKTFILGDSGGYQVANGKIKFDWQRFYETPKQPGYVGVADKTRRDLQNYLEHTCDYSMVLDIPSRSCRPPWNAKTGLKSFRECLDATIFNNEFFIRNMQGKTKYLNVIQGSTMDDAYTWYEAVKHFPFEGWALGDFTMKDVKMFLTLLIRLRDDQMLDPGKDLVHILGTSKLDVAIVSTIMKRILRESTNDKMEITYDCASPFLATAYGQVYSKNIFEPAKFSYYMEKAYDNKKLTGSQIPFPYGNSPFNERLTIGDVCYYAPGHVNKLGKEPKTSWDTVSYFLMMAHNIYQHINAVQKANQHFDIAEQIHSIDLNDWRSKSKTNKKQIEIDQHVPRRLLYFKILAEEVFKSETPFDVLDQHEGLLDEISKGLRQQMTNTNFNSLFYDEDSVLSPDELIENQEEAEELLEEIIDDDDA